MDLTREDLLAMYRWMVLTRVLDLRVCDLLKERSIPEGQHASTGQEAIGVGACYCLRPDDIISPALRSRAARLIRGINVREQMAAMMGKATGGAARGRHVSRHMGDMKLGVIPCTASVGSVLAVATGAGLACKLNEKGQVVLAFFGDGASNTGVFHESLNCASIYKLPVIYICENNQYAISTHVTKSTSVQDIAIRSASYSVPGKVVDGNDVLAVYEATREAVARARAGEGPSLLECKTYRWRGHTEMNHPRDFRLPGDDYDQWLRLCPIERFKSYLLSQSLSNEAELSRIDVEVAAEVEDAIQFAIESPYPAPEDLFADVLAPTTAPIEQEVGQ